MAEVSGEGRRLEGGGGGGVEKKEAAKANYFVETKIESGEKGAQTIEIIFMKEPFNWLYFWLF